MLLDAWASQYAMARAKGQELFEDDDFDKDALLAEAERRALEAQQRDEVLDDWTAEDVNG